VIVLHTIAGLMMRLNDLKQAEDLKNKD
jgi:hypothetical protein